MNKDRCLIVVINWKGFDLTCEAIRFGQWGRDIFDILIFDNEAKQDQSEKFRAELGMEIFYVNSEENIGFTGACNESLKWSVDHGYAVILFLNNDARLSAQAATSMLSLILSDRSIGLVSPRIKDGKDSQFEDCGATLKHGIFTYHPSPPDPDSHRLYLYGTALMGNVPLLSKLGGFDDRYFAYWEDFSLCHRMIRAGYQTRLDRQAVVYHQNNRNDEVETPRSRYYHYYMTRNGIFFWKSLGLSGVKPLYWHMRSAQQKRQQLISKGAKSEADAIKMGLWDGLLGHGGKWRLHP